MKRDWHKKTPFGGFISMDDIIFFMMFRDVWKQLVLYRLILLVYLFFLFDDNNCYLQSYSLHRFRKSVLIFCMLYADKKIWQFQNSILCSCIYYFVRFSGCKTEGPFNEAQKNSCQNSITLFLFSFKFSKDSKITKWQKKIVI